METVGNTSREARGRENNRGRARRSVTCCDPVSSPLRSRRVVVFFRVPMVFLRATAEHARNENAARRRCGRNEAEKELFSGIAGPFYPIKEVLKYVVSRATDETTLSRNGKYRAGKNTDLSAKQTVVWKYNAGFEMMFRTRDAEGSCPNCLQMAFEVVERRVSRTKHNFDPRGWISANCWSKTMCHRLIRPYLRNNNARASVFYFYCVRLTRNYKFARLTRCLYYTGM